MAETSPLQAAFSELGEPLPGELSDAKLVEAALARFATPEAQALVHELEGASLAASPVPSGSRRRGLVVIVGLAAAVALAFSLWGAGLGLPRGVMDSSAYGSAASMVVDQELTKHAAQAGVRPKKTNARRSRTRTVVSPQPVPEVLPEVLPEVVPEVIPEVVPEVIPEQGELENVDSEAAEPAPTGGSVEHTSEEPTASADELLAQAQAHLAKGHKRRARRAYRALIEHYPGSREARASRVTLGRIALAGGHARKALGWFERYLAGGKGPLSEEAEVGRVQALGDLGRVEAEQRAIESFLADPGRATSLYRGRLGRRLKQLKDNNTAGEQLP